MQTKSDIVHGSVRNKIVSSDLQAERFKRDFDIEGNNIFKHVDYYASFEQYTAMDEFCANDPILRNSHEFYEMTREEQLHSHMKKLRRAFEIKKQDWFVDLERFKNDGIKTFDDIQLGGMMSGLHFIVFLDSLWNFGTPE